jgi:hypothetical protein
VTESVEPMFAPLPDGRFMPSAWGRSGWGAEVLNGGLPSALLARAVARAQDDPDLQLARLTVDLFRPVPRQPLEIVARPVRVGRRIAVYEASVVADGVEVTRASALLLRRTEGATTVRSLGPLPDPESLEPSHFPGTEPTLAHGFSGQIDVRWVSRGEDGFATAWLRLPMALIDGEETTPLMRAAALSDFGNRLSQIARGRQVSLGERPGGGSGFINTDITLYLVREPIGEWIAMSAADGGAVTGIGTADVIHADREGVWGHSAQAQLANSHR